MRPLLLPDVISSTLRWLLPERLSDRVGVASGTEPASGLTLLCETLMTLSGVYLVVALLIQSHSEQLRKLSKRIAADR